MKSKAHKIEMIARRIRQSARKASTIAFGTGKTYKPNGKRERYRRFMAAYKRDGAVNITVYGGI
jgi:hypothetical protein